MSLKIMAIIECDECGVLLEGEDKFVLNLDKFIEYALAEGWMCFGVHHHLCPDCSSEYSNLDYDYRTSNMINMFDEPIAKAMFKYWAIKPLLKKRVTRKDFERKVEHLKQYSERYTKKHGVNHLFSYLMDGVTVEVLMGWVRQYEQSPFKNWQAFYEPLDPTPMHPKVQAIVDAVIDEYRYKTNEINEVWDEIVKRIAEQLGKEMEEDPALFFPSQNMVLNRIREQLKE